MGIIKTDWRSCLRDKTLSDLMTCKIESAPILPVATAEGDIIVPAFDPNKAILQWYPKKGYRRAKIPDVKLSKTQDENNNVIAPTSSHAAPHQKEEDTIEKVDDDEEEEEEDECYYSDCEEDPLVLRDEELRAYALLYNITKCVD